MPASLTEKLGGVAVIVAIALTAIGIVTAVLVVIFVEDGQGKATFITSITGNGGSIVAIVAAWRSSRSASAEPEPEG